MCLAILMLSKKWTNALKTLSGAFDESTLNKKMYMWYKFITEGREEVNDDARRGRLSTSTNYGNLEALTSIVMESYWISIREVVEDVDKAVELYFEIFSDVPCMESVVATVAPKLLHFDQKNVTWTSFRSFLQDIHEALRRTKTEKSTPSSIKCEDCFHCFFDYNNMVHFEFVPDGRTVIKEFDLKVSCLSERIRKHARNGGTTTHGNRLFMVFCPKIAP